MQWLDVGGHLPCPWPTVWLGHGLGNSMPRIIPEIVEVEKGSFCDVLINAKPQVLGAHGSRGLVFVKLYMCTLPGGILPSVSGHNLRTRVARCFPTARKAKQQARMQTESESSRLKVGAAGSPPWVQQ